MWSFVARHCLALSSATTRCDFLKRLGNQLVQPFLCLVSFESGYRLARRLLSLWRYNPAGQHRAPLAHGARAHYRSHMPDRASRLVLGADCQEAINILRDAWEPMTDWPPPLEVESVFRMNSPQKL